MTGYAKLFSSILSSTIWREGLATKIVWVTMMAMADQDGVVEASLPGLAHISGVTVQEAESAVAKFLSPDPYSRSPENEGRRIEPVDGGWRLLNHFKYRFEMSPEDIKEKARIRQQRHRARQKVTPERHAGVTERDVRDKSRMSRHTEANTEAKAKAENQTPFAHSLNERDAGSVWDASRNGETQACQDASKGKGPEAPRRSELVAKLYSRYPRKVARAEAYKAIGKAVVAVARAGVTDGHPDFNGDEAAAAQWLKGRVDLYAQSPQAQQQDKSKVPYPATWFNSGRYDDDSAEWSHVGTNKGSPSGTFGHVSENVDPDPSFEDVLSRPDPAWMKVSER